MSRIRTYIAGLGSSGALIAAAIAALIAVSAFVATDAMPGGTAGGRAGAVLVDSNAPEAAARLAAVPGTAPAATAAVLPAAVVGALPGTALGGGTTTPGNGSDSQIPIDGLPGGPGDGGNPPPPPPPPPPPGGGLSAGIVDQADQTVTGATGIDLGLGDKTKPLTDAVDGALEDLPGVGLGGNFGSGRLQLPSLP